MEIHLGHGGSPCPERHGAAHVPAASGGGVEGIEGESEPAANAFGDQAQKATSDEAEWDDEDDEDDGRGVQDDQYGLPRVSGADVCTVVDKSGVHRLRVRPCRCVEAGPLDLQYLDMGLFPASLKRIQTAFTFAVLDDFRMDNLECKTAGLKYYSKLRRLTSNTFPHSVPVRHPPGHLEAHLEEGHAKPCFSPGQIQGAPTDIKVVAAFEASEMAWFRALTC